MTTSVRTFETREDALRRLAQVARESGVKLLRDTHGEMWATSVSEPGWLYPVTPERCGCRGFAMYRRCRHVAALLAHLGYFDPEPPAVISTACQNCNGSLRERRMWLLPRHRNHRDGCVGRSAGAGIVLAPY